MPTALQARLPKQVQAASERARAILEAQKAKRENLEPPPGVEVIEHTEIPIPSLSGEQKGAQPAVPPKAEEDGRDLAYWKHRAKTLDGALKSAKDKHAATVSDLNQKITDLQVQLRDAQDALAAAQPVRLEDHFTAEEIETLGEAEARIMAAKLAAAHRAATKVARAETQAAAPAPKEPSAPAAAPEPEVSAEEDEFYAALDVLMPNWPQINKDRKFHAFCGAKDERTGFTNQERLDAAHRALNAEAAAMVFREFEASLNVVNVPPPPPAPAGRNAGGRESNPSPPPRTATGRPSQAEISEHFKNRSLYHHKPEHPKHVTEEVHKAFLARLQPAA